MAAVDLADRAARPAQVGSPPRRWSRAVDLILLLCCLAGGAAAGWWGPYLIVKAGRAPFFYQKDFAPAVAAACGHGYVNLNVPAAPGLGDFLAQGVPVFECSQLVSPLPVIDLNPFQRESRYLELSVAAVWWFRHIAWDDLDVLYAVFGATVGGLLYGLFRLAAGPLLSVLATVLVLGSPMHLGNLPHLRDYAKAPFLLALLLIMSWLAAGSTARSRTPWLALLAGVVLGVGLGFRPDLLIAIPPVLVVLVALVPGDHSLRLRLGTVLLFVAGFVGSAMPVLADYSRGSNTAHVIILGLMTGKPQDGEAALPDYAPFDRALGIEPAAYDLGYRYNDSYVNMIVRSMNERLYGAPGSLVFGSAEYDRATAEWLRHAAVLAPADMLARGYAAVLRVLEWPFDRSVEPFALESMGRLKSVAVHRFELAVRLQPWVVPAGAAALVGIALFNWRAAAWLVLVLCVFAGGSALQFDPRHFFYLEFLGWWMFAACLGGAYRWLRRALGRTCHGTREDEDSPRGWRTALPGVGFLALVAIAVVGALSAARAYQQRTIEAQLERQATASMQPLQYVQEPLDGDRVRLRFAASDVFAGGDDTIAGHPVGTGLLRLDVGGSGCRSPEVPIVVRYETPVAFWDHSRNYVVPLDGRGGETRVLIPIYELAYPSGAAVAISRFIGIEIAHAQMGCLQRVGRLSGFETDPVLLSASLLPDWKQRPLYQQFRGPAWVR